MKQTITLTNGINTINFHYDGSHYWMTAKVGVFTMFDPNYKRLSRIDIFSKTEADSAYRKLQNMGYHRVVELQKVASPKTTTPKLIWCKESKKIWAMEYNRRKNEAIKGILNLKGKEYHEARVALEATLKADMKIWEAENADQINEMLQKRWAEENAING